MHKKNKIIFSIIMAVVLLFSLSGCAEDNDYARITDMDYKAVVVDEPGSEGKIVVTERITFDVHAAYENDLFWELWRDLCENTVDGVKVHYKVNSVKQIMPDGTEVVWPESPQLYWYDEDYVKENEKLGPGKWFHSEGPYDEYLRQYECLLFYVDGLYREEVTFEIEYEMYNAVLRYNDCSDLYISMYSGDTIQYLESFSAEILIPDKDMPSEGNYKFTTYGTNAHSFPVEESKTKNPGYHTFFFDLTQDELQFRSYNEYIEFDLVAYGDDKHVFAEYASENDYSNDDVIDVIWEEQEEYANIPAKFATYQRIICIICMIVSALVVFAGINNIASFKRKHPYYMSKQPLDTYRDIPSDLDPNLAAELVFCKDTKKKDDGGVYSALLLNLARKKYVTLKDASSGDVTISINDYDFDNYFERTNREPLTTCERSYFDLIKRHARTGSISMNTLQSRISTDHGHMRSFVNDMKRAVVRDGVSLDYFQNTNWLAPKSDLESGAKGSVIFGIIALLANFFVYPTRLELVCGGFVILGIACIINGIYLKSQAHKYVLLTEKGEEEYNKWRGLYNFLKSDTLMNERTVVELPLWEKYLVYATAFGISEKVIKAIKIRCPEMQAQTQEGRGSIVYNSYCRSGRIRTSGARFHSSVRSGYHGSSISSSGGSFSGGYGGGGRGGGGGGGGH